METVAETELPAAALTAAVIKLGSGYPAIMSPLMEIQSTACNPIRPTLLHPALEQAAAPHQDTLSSSSLTSRVSLLVDSLRHTPGLLVEKLYMSRAVPPARAAIIPKKTLT